MKTPATSNWNSTDYNVGSMMQNYCVDKVLSEQNFSDHLSILDLGFCCFWQLHQQRLRQGLSTVEHYHFAFATTAIVTMLIAFSALALNPKIKRLMAGK